MSYSEKMIVCELRFQKRDQVVKCAIMTELQAVPYCAAAFVPQLFRDEVGAVVPRSDRGVWVRILAA